MFSITQNAESPFPFEVWLGSRLLHRAKTLEAAQGFIDAFPL